MINGLVSPYAIPGIVHPEPPALFINRLLSVSGITHTEMFEPSRKGKPALIRAIGARMLRIKYPFLSYAEIGRMLGNRNHATIIYLINKANTWLDVDKKFVTYYESIEKSL